MPPEESRGKAPSGGASKTAIEKYFGLSEEERKKASSRPLSAIEKKHLDLIEAPPPSPKPLSEVERVYGTKVPPAPKAPTPFEEYFHKRKVEPLPAPAPSPARPVKPAEPVRAQTTLERLFNVPKPPPPPPPPREPTALEKTFFAPPVKSPPRSGPKTPFEEYFWKSEEEKKRVPPKPLTLLEKVHLNLIEKPTDPPVKELTEVERIHKTKAVALAKGREPTPFETYFHMPKPKPPERPLTDTEKLRLFMSRHEKSVQLIRTSQPDPCRVVLNSALVTEDIIINASTRGIGKVGYLPEERGIIQKPAESSSPRWVPKTPFEKYFWMSEEEKKRTSQRPLTAVEIAHLNPVQKPLPTGSQTPFEKYFHSRKAELPQRPLTAVEAARLNPVEKTAPAAPLTPLEIYFHSRRQESSSRPLTEVEKVHGAKAEASRPPTALELYYHEPSSKPLSRPLTEAEKVFGTATRVPKPLTALEQYVMLAVQRRNTPPPEILSDPCTDCKETGRITYPPDSRGVINRSACPRCEGRGRILRRSTG